MAVTSNRKMERKVHVEGTRIIINSLVLDDPEISDYISSAIDNVTKQTNFIWLNETSRCFTEIKFPGYIW